MKKKIGILTFHRADNVGAVLQAYALSKYITDMLGIKAEIIDYKCKKIEDTRYTRSGGFIKNILISVYYMIKRAGFNRFRKKYLPLSNTEYTRGTIGESNLVYDTFVSGSDQIWNSECSDNDLTYFLDFVNEDKSRIAYAASIGAVNYTNQEVESYKEYLGRYKAISVREQSSINKLDLPHDTWILPDPVFLLNKEEWGKISRPIRHKKKYVFVYLIQEDINVLCAAKEYAKQHDCEIIANKTNLRFFLNNSPDNFLSWIENAEAVFTNSFHGTAFSIIYQKKLAADIVLKNGGTNNRIKELLISSDLERCIIIDSDMVPKEAKADIWLQRQKSNARRFLIQNI